MRFMDYTFTFEQVGARNLDVFEGKCARKI